jgi:hypothetical protein
MVLAVTIRIRRSKMDEEGQGAEVAILRGCRLRPVEAVQSWLAAAEITDGPVFREVKKGGLVQAVPLTPHSAAQIRQALRQACRPRRPGLRRALTSAAE